MCRFEQAAPYACADADYTYRLVELYKPMIADMARGVEKLFREVEMRWWPVLMEMERTRRFARFGFSRANVARTHHALAGTRKANHRANRCADSTSRHRNNLATRSSTN